METCHPQDNTFDLNQVLNKLVVKRLQDMGRAEEKLFQLLNHEVFDTLSKHNEYWQSQHQPEDDKLDEARRTLMHIQDKLFDIQQILSIDE